MKFISALTIVFTSLGMAAATEIPQGPLEGTTFENGTMLVKPAGAPDSEFITVNPNDEALAKRGNSASASNARLGKRGVGCFYVALDHAGTDRAVRDLKAWAGSSGTTLTSYASKRWIGYTYNNAIVYYCINAPYSSGNLDTHDINTALSQMDAACPRYTTSYYNWPGSVEFVGKAKWGDVVCS